MEEIINVINKALPDNLIQQSLIDALGGLEQATQIEIGEDEFITLPKSVHLEITTKVFIREYFNTGFGSGYRAQVAIGGVTAIRYGVAHAAYGFATLYYNANGHLITIDYHRDSR